MRRIMVVLMVAAVMVALVATAGPAMAQVEDKAAARAAKKAERKAERKAARQAAKQAQGAQNPGAQKQLPATGGIAAGSVAVLGTGALLVGGGLVVRRAVRR